MFVVEKNSTNQFALSRSCHRVRNRTCRSRRADFSKLGCGGVGGGVGC